MTRPILYLCGPMTGLPEFNAPAFNEAAAQLRDAGYIVVSPTENALPVDAPWLRHMRRDITMMMASAEAVATLPGCDASRGAIAEIGLATHLGLPVHSVPKWINLARVTTDVEATLQP